MALDKIRQKKRRNRPVAWRKSQVALVLFFGLAVLTGAILFLINRGAPGETYTFYHIALDTSIELRLQAENRREAEALKDEVFAEIDRLEGLLSRSKRGSDVERVNQAAGKEAVPVSPETMEVARTAYEYATLTEGAFDPTVAPFLDLWGFLEQQYRVPSAGEIEAVLPLVDYRLLKLNPEAETIYLPEEGMSLDLGGIAKGFIVGRGLSVLSRAGVKHAFLNAGGDIAMLGSKPGGEPWRIGVRHPRESSRFVAVIPLNGGAVVTSGDYERAFEVEGARYHHILDPSTGRPASQLSSVTIIAPEALDADALSTAVFVLGPEKGLALVERLPGIEAVLVTAEMEVLVSKGLKDTIELQ